tara:strand:- start:20361 stop:20855 length:495 start_codon:yes stop_codon:yes gene_type:complete
MELSQIFSLIFARNQSGIEASYDGFEHADSVLQLPGRSNCMNWVLGHIAVYRDAMLAAIGQNTYMSSGDSIMYGYGSQPIYEDSSCLDVGRLIKVLDGGYGVLNEWLEHNHLDFTMITPGELYVRKGDTIGEHLAHLLAHEAIHVGELNALRELALVRLGKGWK